MSLSKQGGSPVQGIPDLRFCPACHGQFYLRKGLCVNLLCSKYYLSVLGSYANMVAPFRSWEHWHPHDWRTSSMYDRVYQNHLALESWLVDQEDADGSSEESSGSLVHVASSDEEEITALERYEQDAAASDRPLQIDKASKAWQSLRAKDKAEKDLKRALKSISGQDNADEDPRVDDIEIVLSPTFRDMVEGADTIEHVNAVDRAYKILKAVQAEDLS
eukprot:s6992_g4.t1